MIKKILMALVLVIILVGCQTTKQAEKSAPAAEDVDSGVTEVNDLGKDLDTKELDNIDKELEELSW